MIKSKNILPPFIVGLIIFAMICPGVAGAGQKIVLKLSGGIGYFDLSEVNEFIQRDLGPEGLVKSVVVVATSNEPALVRVHAASTATAIAEYFRDQGKDVMLFFDTVNELKELFDTSLFDPAFFKMLEEHEAGGFYFSHGHLGCEDRPLIMGHEHPSIRLFDSVGAYVKMPCFVHFEKEKVLVMPAFSPLAAGTDFSAISGSDTLSPVLEGADLDHARAYGCSDIGVLSLGPIGRLSRARP